MSGWHALNIESDDESDIEVDDTKELQIEDALKLYQNALRFHAEGPASFHQAAEAYQELFESEIFQYPESQPELRRIELYGPVTDDEAWPSEVSAGTTVAKGSFDSGPSTLPQILHLSHKNYAQFRLEYLSARLGDLDVTLHQILTDAAAALDHFVKALDKDDTDVDLWRKTAAVGEILSSRRVTRFCLETVLEDDDGGLTGVLSLPGLEDGLAGEQLRNLLAELNDRLSMLRSSIPGGKRRALSKMLKQRLGVFQDVTQRQKQLMAVDGLPRWTWQQPERVVLRAPATWAEMGELLMSQLEAEKFGSSGTLPAAALGFELSDALQPATGADTGAAQIMQINTSDTDLGTTFKIPTTIDEQYPGLDRGLPTAQPQIASAHSRTHPQDTDLPTMTLVTRKRSADNAGLPDNTEEGHIKSKRTRARESGVEPADNRQAVIDANTRWEHEQQLNEFQAADDWMFETVGSLFERIGVVGFGKAKDVRQEMSAASDGQAVAVTGTEPAEDALQYARADIADVMMTHNDQLAELLTSPLVMPEFGPVSSTATGFSGSLGINNKTKVVVEIPVMPDDGLHTLLDSVNNGWLLTNEVICNWLACLLCPPGSEVLENTYGRYLWSEDLKKMVVQALVHSDTSFYRRIIDGLRQLAQDVDSTPVLTDAAHHRVRSLAVMVQSTFEIHLDVYITIQHPQSLVGTDIIAAQRNRLSRWADLAREAMRLRTVIEGIEDLQDDLSLRFLWATTFAVREASDVSQDHVIECMHDLRAMFVAAGEPTIRLQNNAVMPELSVEILDHKTSEIMTSDFFSKVMDQDTSDPVAVIEKLEPLLNALRNDADPTQSASDGMELDDKQPPPSVPSELVRFLKNSGISARFPLWERLRDAYSAINYTPMVISCHLRIMRMYLDELRSPTTAALPQLERQTVVFNTFHFLAQTSHKVIETMHASEDAFECIDEEQLKLAVFVVWEDAIRVGRAQQQCYSNGLPVYAFQQIPVVIHELQISVWMILYALLREAIYQNSDLYPTFVEDKFDFLRCVHRNLGIRGICGGASRAFVRLLKSEFQHMTHVEGYDSEMAQVFYDLHGLNCFLTPSYELIEHHCPHDALTFLGRDVAMQAVDLLLAQASKLSVRDLIKHSLKDNIEKVHGLVVRKRPTEAILRNREIYRSFFRSPINPLDLMYSLQGDGNDLPVSVIPREDGVLASKGWFFLMGNISLTKYRSQKRVAATPTEDVEIAIAFFMQDLEYSMDNWETWFRLAQAYDTKIEESVIWSAEKLNNNMQEIVQQQRAAIHCYTMATALMHRSAPLAFETSDKMTELYSDFAARLYSSSREPFNMLPFALEEDKFMSMPTGVGKSTPFRPLRLFIAWKLAKSFYERAIAGNPRSWTLRFALGKVLWKMHSAPAEVRAQGRQPSAQQVLAPFMRTIELLPDKKDSREKREPTLEPHYKLVIIVHKLLMRGELSLEEAHDALRHTRYARVSEFPQYMGAWMAYILTVLRNLRTADKANWHHRMIVCAAKLRYSLDDIRGAKQELTQQLFTKTMVLQVWRPECERAGRHFVYTARYTRLLTQIFEQLKDRSSLEALARRVRRKPQDVFEHNSVWQEICNAYLRLLREHADLSEGVETSTFSNIVHEEFLAHKDPLERWMQTQDPETWPALDVLREVQELKKINQSLMKPGPIDDLIGDSYAYLFNTMGKQLWDEERRLKLEEEARRPPPVTSPQRNPMMSLTNLMNMDGASGPPAAAPTTAPPVLPDPPAQRKKTGVGRREIRACAEACVQKSLAVPTAKTLAASDTRVQVVISTNRAAAGDTSGDNSAPASVHDSADDESELSELEEDGDAEDNDGAGVGIRPLFPGLASAQETADPSPASGVGDSVGDEDEEIVMEEPQELIGGA
ncbi:Histone transcription regulator 3 [Teratosphaeriaceae sp. CCFEE 6253]|nr:Histone transcription regulator 3 [Teratosphaeriaceae sp. CCFEE 6253]